MRQLAELTKDRAKGFKDERVTGFQEELGKERWEERRGKEWRRNI